MADQGRPTGRGRHGFQRAASRASELPRKAVEWIGGHELSVLVALAAMMLAVWGFVELADDVMEGETQQFDEWAVRMLRQPDDPAMPLGPRWLHEMGRDITALGGIAVLTLMIGSVAGFLLLRRLYGAAVFLLAATSGGLVASTLLKLVFERERPSIVPHLSYVSSHSFPSGHSLLAAVIYLTLGALLMRVVEGQALKAYFLLVALMLTVLVGVSRVYLGVHYPTDVLAGWAAGLAWAVLCWLVARWLQRRGAVERNTESAAEAKVESARGIVADSDYTA
jgi:undecaprenyl-diphosphatase